LAALAFSALSLSECEKHLIGVTFLLHLLTARLGMFDLNQMLPENT
jgi:hypothetical protein